MKISFILLTLLINTVIEAQDLYDFQLKSVEGDYIRYNSIKGESLTVIDFWATWCKPCVTSIPKLAELSEKYDTKKVSFIGISVDSPRNISKVKPFTESFGISYPVLLDTEQELMRDLNVVAIPTLIVVNNSDEIVYIHEGYAAGDEENIRHEIDQLLTKYE